MVRYVLRLVNSGSRESLEAGQDLLPLAARRVNADTGNNTKIYKYLQRFIQISPCVGIINWAYHGANLQIFRVFLCGTRINC